MIDLAVASDSCGKLYVGIPTLATRNIEISGNVTCATNARRIAELATIICFVRFEANLSKIQLAAIAQIGTTGNR